MPERHFSQVKLKELALSTLSFRETGRLLSLHLVQIAEYQLRFDKIKEKQTIAYFLLLATLENQEKWAGLTIMNKNSNGNKSMQFIFFIWLGILTSCLVQASGKDMAEAAPADAAIIQLLNSPESPAKSRELYETSLHNKPFPRDLTNEACGIMADEVMSDYQNERFELSGADIEVLARLEDELRNMTECECPYRSWIRLTAKFCLLTGFIRYRQAPKKYNFNTLYAKYTHPDTPLTKLENLPWKNIEYALAGEARLLMPQKTGISFFDVLVSDLLKCQRHDHIIFPSFQFLKLEHFIRMRPLQSMPAAVSLEDSIVADGHTMSRDMFFLHDVAHVADMAKKEPKASYDTALLQYAMVGVFYDEKAAIDRFRDNLFKAVELVLFCSVHEDMSLSITSVFTLKRHDIILQWHLMGIVHSILKKFETGHFCDLQEEYGILWGEPDLLHLAAIWLTSISYSLENNSPSPDTFKTTALNKLTELDSLQALYYQLHLWLQANEEDPSAMEEVFGVTKIPGLLSGLIGWIETPMAEKLFFSAEYQHAREIVSCYQPSSGSSHSGNVYVTIKNDFLQYLRAYLPHQNRPHYIK